MSLINAGRMGQVQLLRHLIQDGPYNLQIALVWLWYGILGKQLDINTTPRFVLPTAVTPAACAPIRDQPRNPDIKSMPLVNFQTRFDICWSDQDTIAHPDDLTAEQDALANYSLIYEYFRDLVVPVPGSLPTLDTLTDQLVNLAGAVPTLEDFDRTLLRVTTHDGLDVVAMGNLSALATLWHAAYERGVNPEMWERQAPSAMGGEFERPTAYVKHARFYVNELIPNRILAPGGPTVTNLYFMQLGNRDDYGTAHGVFGIIPQARVGNMMVRRELNGHYNADTTINTTKSVLWSFPAGVAVGARRSLAVLQDFQVMPS